MVSVSSQLVVLTFKKFRTIFKDSKIQSHWLDNYFFNFNIKKTEAKITLKTFFTKKFIKFAIFSISKQNFVAKTRFLLTYKAHNFMCE